MESVCLPAKSQQWKYLSEASPVLVHMMYILMYIETDHPHFGFVGNFKGHLAVHWLVKSHFENGDRCPYQRLQQILLTH